MEYEKANYINAEKKYLKSLSKNPNYAEAWNNLGNTYAFQNNYEKALDAFDKAIEIDNDYGKALLGKAITLKKLGFTGGALIEYDKILKKYNNFAVKKDKQKLLDECVSVYYRWGDSTSDKNIKTMVNYIKDSLQGDIESLKIIINRYFEFFVTKDKNMLAYFFYLYACNNDAKAQYDLSMMYNFKMVTGKVEMSDIIYWLEKSVAQNHTEAMAQLGYMYIKNLGTEDYIKKGLLLINKAVKQGDHNAMETLADCFYNGIGVNINHNLAKKYWLESASLGNDLAIKNLKQYFNITS